MIFRYIRRKLGIEELKADIKSIPQLDTRYLAMLNILENLYGLLLQPEGDDSQIMHTLRCMGLCGGWKIKEQYEKGLKYGQPKQGE